MARCSRPANTQSSPRTPPPSPLSILAIRVLGEFSGSLNNASDRLVLEDAARNPMDAVEYFDGGLWASAADGEGSSLELVDAAADNAMPQAWAASDESAKSAWQTFSYRARGNAFPGTNDPAGYHEFLFGLLDAGEFLIDDISVVEDPDGAARQLIQNGGFEGDALGAPPAAWRLLGTHGEHGRSVVADDGAGGKALRVAATGPAWHQNNLAETTLKDGAAFAAIDPSADYEISFRARWLAGSPQLNTRLYFDRAARTHLLPMPALAGTPGAPNSRAVANLGPIVSRVAHSPIHPAPGEPVTITAAIADPADGVASAKVWWSTGTGFSEIAMAAAGDRFTASIPGQSSGATVQFYIEAEDGGAAASVFPPGGADSRALYRVGAPGDASGDLHRIEVLMTAADEALLTRATSLMSDHRYGGTAIYENEVFYDIGVRLKASQRGRTDASRLGLSLSFPPHHKFRGAHDSIGLDRSGGWRFGRTFGQDEILVHHVLAKAGGIPSMYNDLIYLDGPAAAAGTAQLQLARYEDIYLASQFDGGDQGSVHNYELIYHPLTTNTGGPEGVKLPNPDAVNGVPLRDLGPDTEAYRYYFALGNRRDADDYAGMIRLCETFSQGGAAFDAAIGDAIDVDQWLRAYAAVSLCGVSDSYFNGSNAHNARFFQRPADGRMLLFPWDMDFAFMPGEQSAALRRNADVTKLTADPAKLRLFYGHAHDIMDRAFNAAYFGPWAAHYGALLPGQDLASLTSFVSARAAAAAAECNAAIPPVGFAFTTPGGGSVPGQSAALEGTGWVNVREIRIAGQSAPLAVEWTSADDWRVQVPLAIGANSITLEAYDFQGNLIGTDTVDVTGTATIEPASAANLAITEIHYHPAAPTQAELDAGHGDQDLFEFVELRNIGANPVDLAGVAFTDGIAFGFTGSDVTQLAPGGYALVVSHRAAFELRYLAGLPVAGQYTGNLSNGGEALEIADALGNPIAALTYGDAAPWPAAADGEGPSLEIIDALGDESDPANWRASECPGGTPAAYHAVILAAWKALHFTEAERLDEDISGDLADPDRDQIPNIAEHAFGTDPRAPDAHLAPSVALGGEFLEISVRVPQAAIGAKVRYEISGDLLGWQGAAFAESARTDNGDGTDQVTLRIAAPEGPAFVRAAISVPQ
ncbi:MAG: lamin tail domain-containing protein [Verrucomicrobiales bacterium]